MNQHEADHAATLLTDPILNKLFDMIERDAMESMVSAKPLDHELRASHAMQVQAIRNLRAKLSFIVEEAKSRGKSAIA